MSPAVPAYPYRLPALLLCSLTAVLMIFSLTQPATLPYWMALDANAFHFMNGSLGKNTAWDMLWAAANNRLFDLIPGSILIFLFLRYALAAGTEAFPERAAALLVCILYIIFTFVLFHDIWNFNRISPSGIIPDAQRLTTLQPAFLPKDYSSSSFPGDHAYVTLMASLLLWCLHRRHLFRFLLIPMIFSLPRLMSGAHWMTDTLAGSGSIGLLMISFIRFTPWLSQLSAGLYRQMAKWGWDRRLRTVIEWPPIYSMMRLIAPQAR